MSKFIALLQFLLMLCGCDIGGSTYSHRMASNGGDTLNSRTRVQAGIARFHCRISATGRCHYTLFADDGADHCPTTAPHDKAPACPPAPLRRFSVAAGKSLAVSGLPPFRLCVAAEDEAQDDACNSLRKPAAGAPSG